MKWCKVLMQKDPQFCFCTPYKPCIDILGYRSINRWGGKDMIALRCFHALILIPLPAKVPLCCRIGRCTYHQSRLSLEIWKCPLKVLESCMMAHSSTVQLAAVLEKPLSFHFLVRGIVRVRICLFIRPCHQPCGREPWPFHIQ